MNIFKILSNGEGRIKEPNISAFLGYLFDPSEDHGLGFLFIEEFLSKLGQDFENHRGKYDYEIIYEQGFTDKKKDKVDIFILCKERGKKQGEFIWKDSFDKEVKEVKKVFLIENKIKDSSTTKGQLKSQYDSVCKNLQKWGIAKEDIYMIYLTPEGDKSKKEFKDTDIEDNHKFHIFWKSDENMMTISKLLEDIIQKDELLKIDPIHQEVKLLIKSFVQFVKTDFKSREEEKKERRNDGEYTKNEHKKMKDNKVRQV